MKARDLAGQRFGKLVAVKRVEGGSSKWLCHCDCGNEKVVYGTNLVNGATKSCGCNRIIHSDTGSKLYKVYRQMAHKGVCQEWEDYLTFKDWAMMNGYEAGVKIMRLDVEKPFSPENCEIRGKN